MASSDTSSQAARDVTPVDPSTGESGDGWDYASDDAVAHAVAAAVDAQRAWASMSPSERGSVLASVADRMEAGADELATLATREMGKPIAQSRGEVGKCVGLLRHYGENAASLVAPRTVATEARTSEVRVQPLGVVLGVMPWNFPFWQILRFAVPALTAGNACLVKPADNTAESAAALDRLFAESDAPPGLLASVRLPPERVSDLIDDDRIRGVSLTGSSRAGRAVASQAGAALKPSLLELGGSDAAVVLPGVDFDTHLESLVNARFQNTGQTCIAAKRFLVHADIADAFRERFVEAAMELCIGDPHDVATDLGPLARADLRDGLHQQVEATVVEGARLLIGGQFAVPDESRLAGGFWYEPTVIDQVEPGMTPFREELFGPAASIIEARDDDALLDMANACPYGLSATVWTDDLDRAEAFVDGLEVGAVFVNQLAKSDWRLPFGGVKESGYGRELGGYGIDAFANLKTVWIR